MMPTAIDWLQSLPRLSGEPGLDRMKALLAALGVVTDPTTEGLGDSERALAYTAPAARQ